VTRRGLLDPAFLTALTILLVSAVSLAGAIRLFEYHVRKKPIQPSSGLKMHSLPTELETWEQFRPDPPPLTGDVLKTLGTENYLTRSYVKKGTVESGDPMVLELHLAYYTGLIATVPHVPERCFVAGGVQMEGTGRVIDIPLDLSGFPRDPLLRGTEFEHVRRGRLGANSSAPGSYVRMPLDLTVDGEPNLRMRVTPFVDGQGRRLFAGYFFLANGSIVPTADGVRLRAYRLEDDFSYYCKVQFMSPTADSAEALAAAAGDLLSEAFPEIMRRVPDWVEVRQGRHPAQRQGETNKD